MFDRADVIYTYDGTFEGILCCIFESFAKKELPQDVVTEDTPQLSFTPTRFIRTDEQKAARVAASLPKRISPDAAELIRLCYFTCLEGKELAMLEFVHKGFEHGRDMMDRLTDDTLYTINKAVKHLGNESHLLKGFIRFSVYQNILVTVIHPKNFVLPLIRDHFCDRYCNESFLIYDETHGMGLVYRPYESRIVPIEDLALDTPDEEEEKYRALWKHYYDTVAIQGRYNPKCRMSHMPKRYWDYMTEFGAPGISKRQRKKQQNRDEPSVPPLRETDAIIPPPAAR